MTGEARGVFEAESEVYMLTVVRKVCRKLTVSMAVSTECRGSVVT